MGRIIISENITIDGVIEVSAGADGSGHGGWFARTADRDRTAWAKVGIEEALGARALLMGRRTHAWFVERGWVSRGDEWAERLRELPKHVVSSTALDAAGWRNSTALRGDVVRGVAELRADVPGDVIVYGSGRLVRTLLEHDLVDELRLMTFPFVVGAGERLFGAVSAMKPMRLVDSRAVGDGLASLVYRPDRDA
ncbi:dihydrofolate reductase family protein [Plantactinospora siamensis]|uniref:Dihydrofolate reductase family protein n=1 Tax=Plantactinospora siamensis TaxID=555372 RepID=A0ABV6P228_9ACTN